MKYKIEKVVLFGSRARGDNSAVSDYDIAIYAQTMSPIDRANVKSDLDEIATLKKIDVVFIDMNVNGELLKNIKREGVTIYE